MSARRARSLYAVPAARTSASTRGALDVTEDVSPVPMAREALRGQRVKADEFKR